jgi:16S rRNA processing protein RimM
MRTAMATHKPAKDGEERADQALPAAAGRVCVGVIVGAHGVRGAVRVKSFTAAPTDVAAYGALTDAAGNRRFALKPLGEARGAVLAAVEGIGDRDAAEALRGVRLYAERGAFPALKANEFYYADLVGLAAETRDGTALGRVRAVDNYGAGDVIELELRAGGSAALPFNRQTIVAVELAERRIVVDPPAELLPGAAGAAAAGGRRHI